MSKKRTGSYYTPVAISDFMVNYLFKKIKSKHIDIIEHSVGDGVFIESLIKNDIDRFSKKSITILDINKEELLKAKNKLDIFNKFDKQTVLHEDFLEFQNNSKQYSLIIGNPPYINKKLLSKEVISRCENIHKNAKLSSKKINNIWTSFIVAGEKVLTNNGIMAYVLPTDILQVKYAKEIRELLEKSFDRIEIFTLNTSAFPEIEQQTIILFAFKKAKESGTFFYEINNMEGSKITQISSNGLMISESKWTHYNLTSYEIKLLNKITSKLPKISDFVDVSAGIVTGANNYFIQTESIVEKYELRKFTIPILQKSSYVDNIVNFTKKDFTNLSKTKKATLLISIADKNNLNKNNQNYIQIGIDQNINTRYKCSLRKNWYCIPNISTPPEAFFFKRSHTYPKLMKNTARVYVTDTAYKINAKNDNTIISFIYSFYSVITLIYAELMGRKYGGGVLELTPNEFKELPLFYKKIIHSDFKKFEKATKDCGNFLSMQKKIMRINEYATNKEILELNKIYKKLVHHRLAK